MLFLYRQVQVGSLFNRYLPWWILGALALAVFLVWLTTRVKFLRAAIAWLADQFIVFLFILIPLSTIGLIVVIVRYFI